MSRAIRLTCTAVAAWMAAMLPADARTIYSVQTDHWFVFSLANSCIAVNRPANEYNHSPYNSLTIRAPKTGGFPVDVVFWPGLFEPGKRYRLTLQVEGRLPHDFDAEAVDTYALKTPGPIPDKLVQDLGTGRLLTVGAANVSSSLAFETKRVGDIITHLDICRGMLAKE